MGHLMNLCHQYLSCNERWYTNFNLSTKKKKMLQSEL